MYPPTGPVHFKVILGQNMVFAACAIEYEDFAQLTTNQLELIGKVVKAFGCVEQITKPTSTHAASVLLIIPFVRAFHWRRMIIVTTLLKLGSNSNSGE